MTGPEQPFGTPPEHLSEVPGMDLVRRALEEARATARGQGKGSRPGKTSPQLAEPPAPGADGGGRVLVLICEIRSRWDVRLVIWRKAGVGHPTSRKGPSSRSGRRL